MITSDKDEAAHSYLDSSTLVPVFRFYNYETGHHFFTVSEAQSEMIKGKIASGEWFSCYCLTEPNAGSDANSGKTKAVLSDDGKCS